MQKAEPRHIQARNQPAARQHKGAALAPPQSEQIVQLEAMAESSAQVAKIAQLTAMVDASPTTTAQRKLAGMIHTSPAMTVQHKAVEGVYASPIQRQEAEEALQENPAQRAEAPAKPNHTGLPDNLKRGIESLSGLSMDNVRVHYNSSQPAQLNALAYAQGTDIHVASGQERHLPHEAWHIVQQAQGRVKPTMQMKEGVPVNDDKGLESEADVMGERAARVLENNISNRTPISSVSNTPMQRKVGFEFETDIPVQTYWNSTIPYNFSFFTAKSRWKIVNDNGSMEFVTEPFTETADERESLIKAIQDMVLFVTRMATLSATTRPFKIKNVSSALGTTHSLPGTLWNDDIYGNPSAAIDPSAVKTFPQATGGVTLENIPTLMIEAMRERLEHLDTSPIFTAGGPAPASDNVLSQAYGNVSGLNRQQVTTSLIGSQSSGLGVANSIAEAKQAVDDYIDTLDVVPPHRFRKLRGLLSLVILYLKRAGGNFGHAIPYSKAAFPLMHRTNFKVMYDALGEDEKALFTTDWVLNAAGLAGTEDTDMFNDGYGSGADIQHGPKRGEWIDSIRAGTQVSGNQTNTDKLSKDSKSSVVSGHSGSADSLGAFNQLDDSIAGLNELAVLEIRSIPRPQGIGDWYKTALKIFDVMKGINNPGV